MKLWETVSAITLLHAGAEKLYVSLLTYAQICCDNKVW